MFYRCKTAGDTWERLDLKSVTPLPPLASLKFSKFTDEIVMEPPWPKCKIYCLEQLGPEYMPDMILGNEKEELPDIITNLVPIVSEKVKNIITEEDEYEHQFKPMNFLNSSGQNLEKGTYYYFHIRRALKFEDVEYQGSAHFAITKGSKFLNTIQGVPGLRERVESLPVWRAGVAYWGFFMNEPLVSRLKQEKLKYFEDYKWSNGDGEECLGYV